MVTEICIIGGIREVKKKHVYWLTMWLWLNPMWFYWLGQNVEDCSLVLCCLGPPFLTSTFTAHEHNNSMG